MNDSEFDGETMPSERHNEDVISEIMNARTGENIYFFVINS